jgi:hypothetical protein
MLAEDAFGDCDNIGSGKDDLCGGCACDAANSNENGARSGLRTQPLDAFRPDWRP